MDSMDWNTNSINTSCNKTHTLARNESSDSIKRVIITPNNVINTLARNESSDSIKRVIITPNNVINTLCEHEIKQYDDLFDNNIFIDNSSTCFDINKLSLYLCMFRLKINKFIHVSHIKDDKLDNDKGDNFKMYLDNNNDPIIIGYNTDEFTFNTNDNNEKNLRLIRATNGITHEIGHYIYRKTFTDDLHAYYYNTHDSDTRQKMCYVASFANGMILGSFVMTFFTLFFINDNDICIDMIILLLYFTIISLVLLFITYDYLDYSRKEETFADYYSIKHFPNMLNYFSDYFAKSISYLDFCTKISSTHPDYTTRSSYFKDPDIILYNYPDIVNKLNNKIIK